MIQTPYGMFAKHVLELDEANQRVTLKGFGAGSVATFDISKCRVDGGIEELRAKHRAYLDLQLKQK